MSVDLLVVVRKRNEAQIHRIQHQLDRHKYRDDISPEQKARDPKREQHRAEREEPGNRHVVHQSISFLASTIAPMIAISTRTEVTSNGNRYVVKSARPTSCAVPP